MPCFYPPPQKNHYFIHIKRGKGGFTCQSKPHYMKIFALFLKNVLFTLGCICSSGFGSAFAGEGFVFSFANDLPGLSRWSCRGRPSWTIYFRRRDLRADEKIASRGKTRGASPGKGAVPSAGLFPGAVGLSLVSLPRAIPGGCEREINRWKSFP